MSAGLFISAGPISAGKEKIIPLDDFNVVGTTKSLGVGIGSPVDVSVTASITETKWSFNIYEIGNKIKNSRETFWSRIGA